MSKFDMSSTASGFTAICHGNGGIVIFIKFGCGGLSAIEAIEQTAYV